MNAAYAEVITKTFRDDAIRSVSIIDDDALSYKRIVDQSKNLSELLVSIKEKLPKIDGEKITAESLLADVLAIEPLDLEKLVPVSEICDFFQKIKIICDVDTVAEHLDYEKVRKSDLIILDYHLSPENSIVSRDLICKLSDTPHMNMVVVYTSHPLNDAWKETALTLRGSKESNLEGYKLDLWETLSDDEYFPKAWASCVSEDDIECIIKNNTLTQRTISDIKLILQGTIAAKEDYDWLICEFVESFLKHKKKVTSHYSGRKLFGDNSKVNWLQVGNVFVTFYKKNEVEDSKAEPEAIWNRLNDALVDWNPSYYRLVLSEIQNRLEDQGLSMDVLLGKEIYEQASVLWNILPKIDGSEINESIDCAINNIYEYFNKNALSDVALRDFITKIVKSISIENYTDKNEILRVALSNCDRNIVQTSDEEHNNITHAFNKELCSVEILPDYITTGTILKMDGEKPEWYLCVSPSCNTVPGQGKKDGLAGRMRPHKVLRFIKMEELTSLTKALKDALQSNTLFISDKGRRIALSTVDNRSMPEIELGVVLNHETKDLSANKFKEVSFFHEPSEDNNTPMITKKLIAVAQLRDTYAMRFQNMQSHYEGRIGVDFVKLAT